MTRQLHYCEVAILALTPKDGPITADTLAAATTWPKHVIELHLRSLVTDGQLVIDHVKGEYRLPEKSDV